MGGPLNLKFANHFVIYQKRPFRGFLGLAGYTQSSGTGELSLNKKVIMTPCTVYYIQKRVKQLTSHSLNFYTF